MLPAGPNGPMLPLLPVTAPRRQVQSNGPAHPGVPRSAVQTLSMLGVLSPRDFSAARLAVLRVWAHGAGWPEADRLSIALAAITDAHHETSSLASSLVKQLTPAALASEAVAAEIARCLLGSDVPESLQVGDASLHTRPWAQVLRAWGPGRAVTRPEEQAASQAFEPPPAAPQAISPSPVQSRVAALGLAARSRLACRQPWLGALVAACLNELGVLKVPPPSELGEGGWPLTLQRSSNMSLPVEAARILTQLLRNAQAVDVESCAAAVLAGALDILAPAAGGVATDEGGTHEAEGGGQHAAGAASPSTESPRRQGEARAASALAATHGTSETVREQMYSVLAVLCSKAPRQVAAGYDRASVAAGLKPCGSVQDALRLPVFLLACLEHETPALRVSVTEALSGVGAMLRNASGDLSLPLNALLVRYATGDNPRARRVAVDWATSVFAFSDVRARFVCCALAGDSTRDIAAAARHGLNPFGKAGVVMGTDVESAAAAAAGGVDSAHLTTAHAASGVVQVALRAWCATVPEVAAQHNSDDEDDEALYGTEDAALDSTARASAAGRVVDTVNLGTGASVEATPESPFHITAPLYPAVESLVAFLTSDVHDTIMGGLGLLGGAANSGAVAALDKEHLAGAVAAAALQRQQSSSAASNTSLASTLLQEGKEGGGVAGNADGSSGGGPGDAKRARTDGGGVAQQRDASVQALSRSVLALLSPSAVGTALRFVLTCLHASAIAAGQDVITFTAALNNAPPGQDSTLAKLSQCVDWALSTDPAAVGADSAVAAGMSTLVALLTSAPAVFAPRYAHPAPLRWLLGFLGHPSPAVRAGAAQATGVVALALPVLPGMSPPLTEDSTPPQNGASMLGLLSQLVLVVSAHRDSASPVKADQHAGCMAATALTVALAQGACLARRVDPATAATLRPVLSSAVVALVSALQSSQPAVVAGAAQGLAVVARQGGLPLPLTASAADPDAASQASVIIALGKLLQGGGAGGGTSAEMAEALKKRAGGGAAAATVEDGGDFMEPERGSSSVTSVAQAAALSLGALAGSLGGAYLQVEGSPAARKRLRLTALDTLLSVSSHGSPGLLLTVGAALGEGCFGGTADTSNGAAGALLDTKGGARNKNTSEQTASASNPDENAAEVAHVITRVYDRMVVRGGSKSRQGGCTWLLSLLSAAPHTAALQPHLLTLHSAFLRVLGDKDGLARSVGSRGLALVYEAAAADAKEAGGAQNDDEVPPTALQASMVQALLDTLSGKRTRIGAAVTATEASGDTPPLEPAQGGGAAAPSANKGATQQSGGALALSAGGDASFKALCAVANDAGQPDLVYRFLALAGQHGRVHARGAAGAGIEALLYTSARRALMPHLRAVLPTIFRFCFDPLASVRGPMRRLWGLLGGGTASQLAEHAPRLLHECLRGARQSSWREREGAYAALGDLLAGGRRAVKAALLAEGKGNTEHEQAAGAASPVDASQQSAVAPLMVDVWHGILQGMDDVHEDVRAAAATAQRALASLTLSMTGASPEASTGDDAVQQRREASRAAQAFTADTGDTGGGQGDSDPVMSGQGSDSASTRQAVLQAVLRFLLESPWGVANGAKEPRTAALLFVRRLVAAAGANVRPFIAFLLAAALDGVAQMESSDLSYLQSHANAAGGSSLGMKLPSADVLERVRIAAVTSSPLWSVVDTCLAQLQRMSAQELMEASPGERTLVAQSVDVLVARTGGNTSLLTRAATLRVLASVANTLPPAALEADAPRMLAAVQGSLDEPRAAMQAMLSAAGAALFTVVPLGPAQAYIVAALRMASAEDASARAAAGGALRAVTVSGTRSRERLERYLKLVVPVAFIAQHDPEASVASAWSDTWGAICTSPAATVGLYFGDILAAAARRLASPAWAVRQQAGTAILAAMEAIAPPVENISNVFLPAWEGLGRLPAPKDALQPQLPPSFKGAAEAAAAAAGTCGPAWLHAAAAACGVQLPPEAQPPSSHAAASSAVGAPGPSAAAAAAARPAAGLFGQASAPAPVSGGLFGQAAPSMGGGMFSAPSGGGGIFGQTGAPAPSSMFGGGGTSTQTATQAPPSSKSAGPPSPAASQAHPALLRLPALLSRLQAAAADTAQAGDLMSAASRGGPGHGHTPSQGLFSPISQLSSLSLTPEQLVFTHSDAAAVTPADEDKGGAGGDTLEKKQAMEAHVQSICAAVPPGAMPLIKVLLTACLGRVWAGKRTVLRAAVMTCLRVLPKGQGESSVAATEALLQLIADQATRSSADWEFTSCCLQCVALVCLDRGPTVAKPALNAVLQCVHDVFAQGVLDQVAPNSASSAAVQWLSGFRGSCSTAAMPLEGEGGVQGGGDEPTEGGAIRLGGGGQDGQVAQRRLASRNKAEQRSAVAGACLYVLACSVGTCDAARGVCEQLCKLAKATAAGHITQSGSLPSALLTALNHALCLAAARTHLQGAELMDLLEAAAVVLGRGDTAQPKLSRPASLAAYQCVCRGALAEAVGAYSAHPGDSAAACAGIQSWLQRATCTAARDVLTPLVTAKGGAAEDAVVRESLQAALDMLSIK